jgi:hypothetical protein
MLPPSGVPNLTCQGPAERAATCYFLRPCGARVVAAGFAAGLDLVWGGRLAVRVAPRSRAAADLFKSALSTR